MVMPHADDTAPFDLGERQRQLEGNSLLRFIACGSVDDGKSTLLGRLLKDARALTDDQLTSLAAASADPARAGMHGGEHNHALLLSGLSAEREQGITSDVAWRFFSTTRRQFFVADTPGNEQYTRNMVTGALTADLAVVLIDARLGVLAQARRHSHLLQLLGLRHVVVAVNKMDLVGHDEATFRCIKDEYRVLAQRIGLSEVVVIPVSAIHGENLVQRSPHMPWYIGPVLLEHLETVDVDEHRLQRGPLRFSVQWVSRPNAEFRGYAGTLVAGRVRPGDPVQVLPSGSSSRIARIVTVDSDLTEAVAPQSVILTLADTLDVSRGDLLCDPAGPAEVAHQFEATLVWMGDQPLQGCTYLMKTSNRTVEATVLSLKHTLEHVAAETLEAKEIGLAELELDRDIAFDPYVSHRATGGFILIDRISQATVAVGLLRCALRRPANLHWHAVSVDRAARQRLNGHSGAVVWLTGLSGAGKSTLANLLEKRLHASGVRTYLIDGDNIRHGLNKDLGFSAADRVENIRRVAEVVRLMADAGLIVITALISPFRAERRMARELIGAGEFIEVHVDISLEVAERRDPKGLYAKARRGELKNFTGIDSPYEPPQAPELRLDTSALEPEAAVEQLYDLLVARGLLGPR